MNTNISNYGNNNGSHNQINAHTKIYFQKKGLIVIAAEYWKKMTIMVLIAIMVIVVMVTTAVIVIVVTAVLQRLIPVLSMMAGIVA